ncbi:hypothetical protein MKW92_003109 [Papaver armeniacum]|nr:hypothetical protein MKW92_003109 [Papaver armeniacum]
MAAIMERADENLLPSVYKEVGEAFNVGPTQLGYLSFVLKFVQALSSPLAGVLVIRYDRPTILSMGTLCWAISTAGMGASYQFSQLVFWRALNGVGLAIVMPALQSFVADSYKEGARGRGFGMLSLVGTVGGIGGSALATIMAGQIFLGIPGWRCAFFLMALSSSLIALLVFMFVIDPRKSYNSHEIAESSASVNDNLLQKGDNTPLRSVWSESWTAMKAVAKVPTFQFLVLQGIVGTLPWAAVAFLTMWFELIGFDHNSTAALLVLFAIGCAIGSFLGGIIGDQVSLIYPHSGRIMGAQFSASMGIPFSWFLLMVIPHSVNSWSIFAFTLFFMGLTITWCATCANNPMFADVVPTKHRTMVYAFDRAFEGTLSSLASPIVGILSEKIFGYDPQPVDAGSGSTKQALALSRGLISVMSVPFALSSLLYIPLYKTYKQDREMLGHEEAICAI